MTCFLLFYHMGDTDGLLCLFSTDITRQNGVATIEIPERELDLGTLDAGATYRVGLFETDDAEPTTQSESSAAQSRRSRDEPPVEEGEVIDVEIEDMGEEGDGIARVGPGYVIFVPETTVGERVAIELTSVRENVAFGTVVDRHDR
jgi:predicted RNA-binding protein with TRAM domain